MRVPKTVFLLLLVALGIFHILTLPAGQSWGDDWAQYVIHAKNISEGLPYGRIPYLFNEAAIPLFPRSYPPGFSLLLSGVYSFYGFDLYAFKLLVVIFFIATLALLPYLFRDYWPPLSIPPLILMLLFGLNPQLWRLKTNLLSDIPFTFLALLALAVMQADRTPRSARDQAALGAIAGILIGLAYATRTAGILLLATVWIYTVLRHRRPTVFAAIATVSAGAVVLFTNRFVDLGDPVRGYQAQFTPTVLSIFQNARSYLLVELRDFTGGGLALLALFCLLCLGGYWYCVVIQKRWDALAVFLPLQLASVLIWPFRDLRFLLPVLPALLLYALVGFSQLTARFTPPRRRWLACALLAWIAVAYARSYPASVRLARGGIEQPASRQMLHFIDTRTGPNDVIVSAKPRALTLLTGRPSAVYLQTHSADRMRRSLCEIGSRYVIVFRDFGPDREFLEPYVASAPASFERIFDNEDFEIFAVSGSACANFSERTSGKT
jgi:hypothetical protein